MVSISLLLVFLLVTSFCSGQQYQWEVVNIASTAKPPGLHGHSLTYDPVRDRLILYGGVDGIGNFFGEVWQFFWANNSWNLVTWGPKNIAYHTAVYYPAGDEIIIYGGIDDSEDKRNPNLHIYSLNLTTMEFHPFTITAPDNRAGHSAFIVGDSMFIVGGFDPDQNTVLSTYVVVDLILRDWSAIGVLEAGLVGHVNILLPSVPPAVILYGGYDQYPLSTELSNMTRYVVADMSTLTLDAFVPPTNVEPRAFGSCVDMGDGTYFLFGGTDNNEVRIFNYDDNTFSTLNVVNPTDDSPSPRLFVAGARRPSTNTIYYYGGASKTSVSVIPSDYQTLDENDLYALSPYGTTTGPSPSTSPIQSQTDSDPTTSISTGCDEGYGEDCSCPAPSPHPHTTCQNGVWIHPIDLIVPPEQTIIIDIGKLHIEGNFNTLGTIRVKYTPDSHGSDTSSFIGVSGNATLSGTLEVEISPEVPLTVGDTVHIFVLEAGDGIDGEFDEVEVILNEEESTKDECQKKEVSVQQENSGNKYSLLLDVTQSNDQCEEDETSNTWWITVVVVVLVVVLLAIGVTIALVLVQNRRKRIAREELNRAYESSLAS